MKKARFDSVFVCLLVTICFFCLAQGLGYAGVPEKVRIGVTAPLTGPAAEAGIALKQGILLAMEEWNAKGGIYIKEAGKKLSVKFFIEDCQSKPEVGVSVGEKLITREKVDLLIGDAFHSSVTMAVMELAPKYGIPILSGEPVSSEIAKKVLRDPQRYWSYWKGNWNSEALGGSVFYTYKYLIDKGFFKEKNRSVSFIVEDTDWGRSNAEKARELFTGEGWKNLGIETVALGHTDFYPQLTKIKAMNPDILVTSFTPLSSGVALTKQFHEVGMKCGHMAIYFPSRPEFVPQAGKLAEQLLWTTSFVDPVNIPHHRDFGKKIKARWGVMVNIDHGSGYDVANNALDSIERAGSLDAKAIVEALSKLDRKGILGRYVFDQSNHTIRDGEDFIPVPGIQIQNGKNVVIYPASLAVGPFQDPSWLKK